MYTVVRILDVPYTYSQLVKVFLTSIVYNTGISFMKSDVYSYIHKLKIFHNCSCSGLTCRCLEEHKKAYRTWLRCFVYFFSCSNFT